MKDVYNKEGKLLLAAGQELNEGILKKLESLGVEDVRGMIAQDDDIHYEDSIRASTNQIREHLKIKNAHILDSASETVINIIFNSRNKPWWLYVNTLSNYVDWLYSHSINVSIISAMLADALNLKNTLQEIALGAFLHDIGKLMIPKNILQKKSTLTHEELYYIHQHCDLGISMVTDFHLSRTSLDIIQQHHERLDGSGYPLGLKESQIPLHSKIVMIADILDAITSYRPYKSARQIEAAIEELRDDALKYPQDVIEVLFYMII